MSELKDALNKIILYGIPFLENPDSSMQDIWNNINQTDK